MSAAKRQRELNRAKKEHENAKLSAQIATGNVVLTNIAESVMEKLIERQAAQIEMLRKMLKQVCGSYLLEHPDTNIDPFVEALSSTPNQALEQFAERVRKQCIGVCYEVGPKEYPNKLITDGYADAIRAIKDLP